MNMEFDPTAEYEFAAYGEAEDEDESMTEVPGQGGLPAAQAQRQAVAVIGQFKPGTYTLSPRQKQAVQSIARHIAGSWKAGQPIRTVRLVGFSDQASEVDTEGELGLLRTQAVGSALNKAMRQVIPQLPARVRIMMHSHGGSRPAASSQSAAGQAQNRRVELYLPSESEMNAEMEDERSFRRGGGRSISARPRRPGKAFASTARPKRPFSPTKRPGRPQFPTGRPVKPIRPGRRPVIGGRPLNIFNDSFEPLSAPQEQGSEYVRWVQNSLNQVLGTNLPVNGVMGVETRSAVRSFQTKNGLPVDGIVGPDTERALTAARSSSGAGAPAANGAAQDAAPAGGPDGGADSGDQPPADGSADQGEIGLAPSTGAGVQSRRLRIENRTHLADKSQRKGRRDRKTVHALVLHQMACCRSRKEGGYDRIGSHFAILPNGRILQLHPIEALIHASNGFNRRSVAVEFAGNFPSTKGRCWQQQKFGCNKLTQAQIDAGRYLIRHLKRVMNLTHVLAHRQSSGTRENDPGPDIWYHVGQWAIDNLGMKDGGPTFKIGAGNPIPKLWRTWGRVKPQPELEYEDEQELDPESPEHTRWLQQALSQAMGLRLSPAAVRGPAIRSALRSFQSRNALPVSGELTDEVEALLFEAGAPPHRHPETP